MFSQMDQKIQEAISSGCAVPHILDLFKEIYGKVVYPPVTTYQQLCLSHAALYNRCDLLRHLLISGVDPNALTEALPLHTSVYSGFQEAVNILLQNGADVYTIGSPLSNDKLGSVLRENALVFALLKDDVDMVKLLRSHCDRMTDRGGRSAVYLASKYGAAKCLNLLLEEYPASLNESCVDGTGYSLTPLMAAIPKGSSIVSVLLRAGAILNPDILHHLILHTFMNYSPSHVNLGDVKRTLIMLLNSGADVNYQGPFWECTPLENLLMKSLNAAKNSMEDSTCIVEFVSDAISVMLDHKCIIRRPYIESILLNRACSYFVTLHESFPSTKASDLTGVIEKEKEILMKLAHPKTHQHTDYSDIDPKYTYRYPTKMKHLFSSFQHETAYNWNGSGSKHDDYFEGCGVLAHLLQAFSLSYDLNIDVNLNPPKCACSLYIMNILLTFLDHDHYQKLRNKTSRDNKGNPLMPVIRPLKTLSLASTFKYLETPKLEAIDKLPIPEFSKLSLRMRPIDFIF